MKSNTLGIIIASALLLFGLNSLVIYVWDYPLVYCLGMELTPTWLKDLFSLAFFLAAILLIGSAVLGGKRKGAGLVKAIASILLFALIPIWFEVIFNRGGTCG